MKEADIQLANHIEALSSRKLSARKLSQEIDRLRDSMVFFHILRGEGSAEAMLDTELERRVYMPMWSAWYGESLTQRLGERMQIADYYLQSKFDKLDQSRSKLMNFFLFVIASLSASSVSELAFILVLEAGYLDEKDALVFEVSFLAAFFAAALGIYFWPRKL